MTKCIAYKFDAHVFFFEMSLCELMINKITKHNLRNVNENIKDLLVIYFFMLFLSDTLIMQNDIPVTKLPNMLRLFVY